MPTGCARATNRPFLGIVTDEEAAKLSDARWLAHLLHAFAGKAAREGRPGQRLGKAFEHLGPVAIKLGQVLATRADIFGIQFARDLGRLKDALAPFPLEEARREVERSLGRPVEALFTDFGPPVAAASLAHVKNTAEPTAAS